jgi:hypothetical protein
MIPTGGGVPGRIITFTNWAPIGKKSGLKAFYILASRTLRSKKALNRYNRVH